MPRSSARRTVENRIRRLGFSRVAGVDEVGRGSLAGPVVAAAVVLSANYHIKGLRDSKLLTPVSRERLYHEIVKHSTAWALGVAEASEIDRVNVHRAGLRAMHRAVGMLVPAPEFVLVDGFNIPDLLIPQEAVVKGDRSCAAIAAASIVAKVTRDRQMQGLHAVDPRYGFDRHKGYATKAHLSALARFGYSPLHRHSFRPSALFDRI